MNFSSAKLLELNFRCILSGISLLVPERVVLRNVSVGQSCLTLCDPMNCTLPGSSVHGVLQARILEWVVIPFSRGSYQSRDGTWVSHIASRFFTIWTTREPQKCKMYHQLIEKYWLISKNARWVLKRLKSMSKICSWIQLTPSTVEINTYYYEFAKYSKMLQNVSLEKGHLTSS